MGKCVCMYMYACMYVHTHLDIYIFVHGRSVGQYDSKTTKHDHARIRLCGVQTADIISQNSLLGGPFKTLTILFNAFERSLFICTFFLPSLFPF